MWNAVCSYKKFENIEKRSVWTCKICHYKTNDENSLRVHNQDLHSVDTTTVGQNLEEHGDDKSKRDVDDSQFKETDSKPEFFFSANTCLFERYYKE